MNLMEKYLKKRINLIPPKPSPPRQDCQAIFEQTDSEIGAAYLPGTLPWVKRAHPELWVEMQEAEDRINELWLKAKTKTVDVGAFKEAVEGWKTIHLRAIRLFSLVEVNEGAPHI